MADAGGMFGGLVALAVIGIGIVFLVMLFVAPLKLYGIHREIKQTNEILKRQSAILASMADLTRSQVGILATAANTEAAATPPPLALSVTGTNASAPKSGGYCGGCGKQVPGDWLKCPFCGEDAPQQIPPAPEAVTPPDIEAKMLRLQTAMAETKKDRSDS